MLSFSEAIGNELIGTGITVTTLCPGATESEFQVAANLGESKLFKQRNIPTSKEVVDFGYKEMMKGSMTVIPGIMNRMTGNESKINPAQNGFKGCKKNSGKSIEGIPSFNVLTQIYNPVLWLYVFRERFMNGNL